MYSSQDRTVTILGDLSVILTVIICNQLFEAEICQVAETKGLG